MFPFEVYYVGDPATKGNLFFSEHQIVLKTSFEQLTMRDAEPATTSACLQLLNKYDPMSYLCCYFEQEKNLALNFATIHERVSLVSRQELGLFWIEALAKEITGQGIAAGKSRTCSNPTTNAEPYLLSNGYERE